MKRPFGVLASVFILALLALLQLWSATFFALVAHMSSSAPHQGTAPLFVSLILSLLIVWTTVTAVGLWRLRPWARLSVLGLAVVYITQSVCALSLQAVFLNRDPQQSSHLAGIAGAFFTSRTFSEVLIASLGICWLIYFNFPGVKSFFLPHYAPVTPPPPTRRRIPSPILLLALIYFATSALFLFFLIRHLPGLFFGHATPGPWVYAGGATAMSLAGMGLLRLDPRARLATFALLSIGMANAAVSALPHFREPLNLFTIAVLQRLQAPRPLATAYSLTSGSTLPAILLLSVFTLYFAYALHRYRKAFHSA